MPDERAIVRDQSPFTPDTHRPRNDAGSPWRDDAHAVVIGINEYTDSKIPNLRYARADAEAIYGVLTDPAIGRFKPENVTLLLDGDATERNIRSALGTQLPRRAGRDATVVIYYAGHGAPVVDPRSKSVDGLEKYLIPHDAVADDLRSSGISMDAVQQYFSWLDASKVVCFLDSCYSGTAGGRSFDHPSYQTRAMLSDEFLDSLGSEGRFVVTACATNEVSLENAKLGHGIFTQHLVEGLKGAADANGDGRVTIDELYEYVYANVERDARALGGSMNPVKKGSVQGKLYLTEFETKRKARIREALRAAAEAQSRGDGDTALALFREVLSLDPENAVAIAGVAAAVEVEQRRQSELKRQQRLLLGYVNSGDLSMRDLDRALASLQSDASSMQGRDGEYRRLVDGVVAGELTIRSFVRAVELLDSETAEHAQSLEAHPSKPPASTGSRPAAVVPQPRAPTPQQAPTPAPTPAPTLAPTPAQAPAETRTARWEKPVALGGALVLGIIAVIVFWPHPSPPIPGPSATPIVADSTKKQEPAVVEPSNTIPTQRLTAAAPSGQSSAKSTTVQRPSPPVTPQPVAEQPRVLPLKAPTFTPENQSMYLSIETPITIHFDDLAPGDDIDRASAASRISLLGPSGPIAWRLDGNTGNLIVIPNEPLVENTTYVATVASGIRTNRGRTLASEAKTLFTTTIADSLYFYGLSRTVRATSKVTVDQSRCRLAREQSGGNQAWYFIPFPGVPGTYHIHNAWGGPTKFFSSMNCELEEGAFMAGGVPKAWVLWYLTSVHSGLDYVIRSHNDDKVLVETSGALVIENNNNRNAGKYWTITRQGRR